MGKKTQTHKKKNIVEKLSNPEVDHHQGDDQVEEIGDEFSFEEMPPNKTEKLRTATPMKVIYDLIKSEPKTKKIKKETKRQLLQ